MSVVGYLAGTFWVYLAGYLSGSWVRFGGMGRDDDICSYLVGYLSDDDTCRVCGRYVVMLW